ncbi:MAG TPA: hypothetical protein VFS56_08800 [Gemmatimonadaceae bacterium]|nr:hypothetical protein [Gemmatimonadaceae bacterium]
MTRLFAALIAISLAAGCRFGPKMEKLSIASSPRGAMIEAATLTGPVNGELLSVTDDGVVVLQANRVVNVRFAEIRGARFRELGSDYRFGGERRPDADRMARLRRVSRFPQGITPEIQARLLTLYPQ